MLPKSPLDDPELALHAWRRYFKLMRWMFAATTLAVIAALVTVYFEVGDVPIHFYIATALGVGFATLLMATLMGLVFLSSGTGHDDSIAERPSDEKDDQSAG